MVVKFPRIGRIDGCARKETDDEQNKVEGLAYALSSAHLPQAR